MSIPLDEIYQEVVLDHNRKPRNFKTLSNPSHQSHGYNPLCGDDYQLYLSVDGNGLINEASFQGLGCAISKASASMLTQSVKGKRIEEVLGLKEQFVKMCTQEMRPDEEENLGDLVIFEGVKKFPIRVKCATMIWHTLANALER
jgi:nitrogen fixation protein NifU and related proteins